MRLTESETRELMRRYNGVDSMPVTVRRVAEHDWITDPRDKSDLAADECYQVLVLAPQAMFHGYNTAETECVHVPTPDPYL